MAKFGKSEKQTVTAADVGTLQAGDDGGVAVVEKKARPKIVKTPWGERDAEGNLLNKVVHVRGAALPEGYSFGKNNPLILKDFASDADYLDFRADALEKKVKSLRADADAERSGLGKETRAKQKKAIKAKEQYLALLEELKAAGVDTEALMG